MDASLDDIEQAGSPRIREAIARVRAGNVHIAPGYDGEFGTIRIFADSERLKKQFRRGNRLEIPSVLRTSASSTAKR